VAAGARGRVCDPLLAGLLVLALLRAAQVLAADPAATATPARPELNDLHQSTPLSKSPFVGPLFLPPPYIAPGTYSVARSYSMPGSYSMPELPETKTFSNRDFRPRGRSVYEPDPRFSTADDGLTFDQTVWQRLNEYRNRDRIRLLTLWESGASAVSIQTDRKGDPWLQWTSHLTGRAGASHGLLDQLFPVSMFTGAVHTSGHSSSPLPLKPATGLSPLHVSSSAIP
jgi:hypothetical protein